MVGISLTACAAPQAQNPNELTLVTHDSFALDEALINKFETDTGIEVSIVKAGDAGSMVSQLVLTKDDPLGDVVFGIDNTFASRAVSNEVLKRYVSPNAALGSTDFSDQGEWLTAIDYGDVCFNADLNWFTSRNIALPISFADLAKPEYRDLTVVSNPASSSPGLAFLAATVSVFGDEGYADYWKSLVDNGLLVVAGWEDAYFTEFSGSSGAGSRPIVLSYSSSPAAEIREDGKSGTVSLIDTCTRQTEYAGVLAGTDNEAGAQKFIDFLLSPEVQVTLPTSMYVYPVSGNVTWPEEWKQFAPVASTEKVHNLPSERFDTDRETWQKTIAAIIGQ